MSVAVGIPTKNGDGINPPSLFGVGSASPVNYTTQYLPTGAGLINLDYGTPGPVPTISGDRIHTPDLWGLAGQTPVNPTTWRYYIAQNTNNTTRDQTQWRGWTFVINPQTVQPAYPRLTTTFPTAQ